MNLPLLQQISYLPEAFFEISHESIRSVFEQPTLIFLEGEKKEALFVSILLHGNEKSGLLVMQRLLKKYKQKLPRSLVLFIGNVFAAEQDQRCLPDQTDYNRAWPGTPLHNETTQMMQQVIDILSSGPLLAAVDIHNNTGTNPHYGCMTRVRRESRYICSLFNHIAMVFHYPKGVSTMAFDSICPAVTLECAKPGDETGIRHALETLDALLHLDHFPERDVAEHDLQMVSTLANITIVPQVSFSFDPQEDVDLHFPAGFERFNFTELKKNQLFATTRVEQPLLVKNEQGEDITDQILSINKGEVRLTIDTMPAMITPDKSIIRQDCLCYLLQDYQYDNESH